MWILGLLNMNSTTVVCHASLTNCILSEKNTNLFWLWMYSSFEAWLRAFNVKLKLQMFPSILDVLHMPIVETYAQRKIKSLQRLCINTRQILTYV